MRGSRIGWSLGAFAACVVGLVWVIGGACDRQVAIEKIAPAKRLIVITPHNEEIRNAFEVVFANWYQTERGTPVDIQWVVRGTQECLDYINDTFQLTRDAGPRIVPDVLFGGSITEHELLAERDQSQNVVVGDRLEEIPNEVAGLPTHGDDNRWFAVGLISFGIVCNEKACRGRGIEPPQTWTDLADPRFYSWVGLADPSVSGSNLRCMTLILQKHGWQDGWSIIMRTLANSRAFGGRSSDVLRQVGDGVFLAAFAVNFDGMRLSNETEGAVQYVNPPGATALSPDVVSVLRTARDVSLAQDFVRFLLSEQGQVLFAVSAENRRSYGATLYHYPVDPQMYEKYADKLAIHENPIKTDFGLKLDYHRLGEEDAILKPLVSAACGENHVLLQRAWRAVIDAGLPAGTVAELTQPPFDETTAYELGQKYQAADHDEAAKMLADWSAEFRARYERVLASLAG